MNFMSSNLMDAISFVLHGSPAVNGDEAEGDEGEGTAKKAWVIFLDNEEEGMDFPTDVRPFISAQRAFSSFWQNIHNRSFSRTKFLPPIVAVAVLAVLSTLCNSFRLISPITGIIGRKDQNG